MLHRMLLASCLLAVMASGPQLPAGEQLYPYPAEIVSATAEIRGSPRRGSRVVETLARGDAVEVYGHEAGGWLAIRPPVGCFSLVDQNHVELTGQARIGRVTKADARCYVGSAANRPDELESQVRLKLGELVEILGSQTLDADRDGRIEQYVRIAPPAGEFRYVHENEVAKQIPARPDDFQLVDLQVATDIRAASTARARSAQPAGAAPRSAPRTPLAVFAIPALTDGTERVTATSGMAEGFDERLGELNIQLALMVARPAEEQDFSSLRRDAEHLAASGHSALDRGRARLLMERIGQFADIRRRTTPDAGAEAHSSAQDETVVGTGVGDVTLVSRDEPQFDGRGWLMPVHSSGKKYPPYALMDNQGNPVCLVAPTPGGVNLHRYLKKEVGIFGQRSSIPSLKLPYLTADRVIVLNRHR